MSHHVNRLRETVQKSILLSAGLKDTKKLAKYVCDVCSELLITTVPTGGIDAIGSIVRAGADINFRDEIHSTPLMHSIMYNNSEVTLYLLERGAQVNVSTVDGVTPLICAAMVGNLEILKKLLDLGACINETTRAGHTALHVASTRGGNDDCVKALVEAGINVNTQDSAGCTPMHLAVKENATEMIDLLYSLGADLTVVNNAGHTPLLDACAYGASSAVYKLVYLGADPNSTNLEGYSTLHIVSMAPSPNIDMLSYLLDARADINSVDALGRTPVMLAYKDPETVQFFLNRNADAFIWDKQGDTLFDILQKYAKEDPCIYVSHIEVFNTLSQQKATNKAGKQKKSLSFRAASMFIGHKNEV